MYIQLLPVLRRAPLPRDLRSAARNLRLRLASSLPNLSPRDFVRVWSSIAYLYPGLHADAFDEPGDGWPRILRPLAEEAWRRHDAGLLSDAHLYPADAAWAGLYDRMPDHTPEETARRASLRRFAA